MPAQPGHSTSQYPECCQTPTTHTLILYRCSLTSPPGVKFSQRPLQMDIWGNVGCLCPESVPPKLPKVTAVPLCPRGVSEQCWPYRAVLQVLLPYVHSQSRASVAGHVRRHDVVVNQGREVGSHRGEVSAIGQPCVRQKQKLIWGTRGVTRAKCWGQL